MILLMVSIIVRVMFIVFGSVLIVRLIIGEYKNKIILFMFFYFINWKKMMVSKLVIIVIVIFIIVIVFNILVVGVFFGIDSYFLIFFNLFIVD